MLQEILEYLGIGGLSAVVIIAIVTVLSLCIEISPIKINPIQLFGKLVFSSITKEIEQMKLEMAAQYGKINNKLDEHIVQGYRKEILDFQNECLRDVKHTQEQFRNILKAIEDYERYIEKNGLRNGEVEQAMLYIKRVYQRCLDNHDFLFIENFS